jgi:hypothetical protein
LGGIKYIINKQIGGGYSFFNEECDHQVEPKEDTREKEVEL